MDKKDSQSYPPDYLYKINVYGHIFELTEAELGREPKSWLVKAIRDSAADGNQFSTRADLNLFRLIHAYFRGYEIFPLPSQGIPIGQDSSPANTEAGACFSVDAALSNLLADAKYFDLTNLATKIHNEIAWLAEQRNQQLREQKRASRGCSFVGFLCCNTGMGTSRIDS